MSITAVTLVVARWLPYAAGRLRSPAANLRGYGLAFLRWLLDATADTANCELSLPLKRFRRQAHGLELVECLT